MTEDIKEQSTAFERLVWGVITTLIGAGSAIGAGTSCCGARARW